MVANCGDYITHMTLPLDFKDIFTLISRNSIFFTVTIILAVSGYQIRITKYEF